MAAEKAKNFFVIPCHDHANQQTGKAQDGANSTDNGTWRAADRPEAGPASRKEICTSGSGGLAVRNWGSHRHMYTYAAESAEQMNEEGVTDDVFRGVIILFKCR